MVLAQTATTPQTAPGSQQGKPVPIPTPTSDPEGDKPIVSDKDFNAALPKLSDDINAPLEPIPQDAPFTPQTADKAPDSTTPPPAPVVEPGTLPPPSEPPTELAQPLPPLDSYNTAPVVDVAVTDDKKGAQVRYDTVVNGLDALKLDGQFRTFSALKKGGGKAANIPMVTARAREDEALAIRLMKSKGYYDASAVSVIENVPNDPTRVRAVINAVPGNLYKLGEIKVDAYPVAPNDLITKNLPLRTGDPIEAERIQGAEANVSLQLGQTGYPFARLGTRDILLDEANFTGDYTLPIDTGPRSSFGDITTTGKLAFGADHIRILRRFKPGQLYDTRGIDDLRKALVATGLFSTVAVEPVDTGKDAPDGTRIVDIAVTQRVGKTRSIAATGGYSTGQGLRAEATYTARNAFPPEGALIFTAVGGTQEQGAGATFRRSNWRQRDRTLSFGLAAGRNNYDAFNAVSLSLIGRVSYDSTPIWQKKFTYQYGFELTGTNEDVYDFGLGKRKRGTYFIAALPLMGQFDRSKNKRTPDMGLLDPTQGYRIKLTLSPETSVRGAARPYLRAMAEASGYYPVMDSLTIAGRVRVGSIQGISRDDLVPSRRYYGGGGGSVRGYGYQRLGPFDPNGDPVGGRSLNEFALEARYRVGNFGIVPFVDAGNSYESSMPKFNDLRFGAGIGGRFYTNFGPVRIDVATPLNRRKGDSRIALYISIGQAF
ncbi:BamA/TamA family outer membrane protein [Sphingomonas panacisoli]|uniref:BamA/TamA family outer membrane protein n=1 Tax=Sphingomonas panacisoli TaxID=1813879 RepID=A0A5B8LPR8_9SPHN|nr:BamA/TamA family outer membrane protein [Sphingomonas panacisoli]